MEKNSNEGEWESIDSVTCNACLMLQLGAWPTAVGLLETHEDLTIN